MVLGYFSVPLQRPYMLEQCFSIAFLTVLQFKFISQLVCIILKQFDDTELLTHRIKENFFL